MDCFNTMMKYLVFLANLVFFIGGCIILGVGSYMYAKMNTYFEFVGGGAVNSTLVIIIVGVFIALVAFFGCCGICTENSCLVYTFAIIMSVILVAEVGGGVAILVYKNDAGDFISNSMIKAEANYGQAGYEGVTNTWDHMQDDFTCCGVKSYKDWANTTFSKGGEDAPDSCCIVESAGCGKGALKNPTGKIYESGCFAKFETAVKENGALVGGIAVGFGVIQLLGVIISCSIARKMSDKDNYV